MTLSQSPQALVYDQIEQHEGGWLLDILERPVLVWGAQGSYKSYFSAYLALLRMHLKGHVIEVNDPHLQLNKNQAWRYLIQAGVKAYGSNADYAAIACRIEGFIARLKNATESKQWHTSVFDEVTQYSLEPDTKAVASSLVIKCVSDCRKAKESPILISHNNTSLLLGGSSGTHKAIQEGLIQLHLYSTSKGGEYSPLFKGELTGLPNSRGEFLSRQVSIDPSWMNPEAIARLFQQSAPIEVPVKEVTSLTAAESLGEPLRTVWLFAKKQGGWVTAREVKQQSFALLKEADTDKIRQYFGLLSDMGAGSILETKHGVVFKAD